MNSNDQLPNPIQLPSQNRHNGKIARLPKAVRDQINQMIDDGLPYADIIEALGEAGRDLTAVNLSRWKDGGYQDWVAEQTFVARLQAQRETPGELVRDFDATNVTQAALQLGALHIFQALRDLSPGSLDQKLGGDSVAFVRLLNSLARASRETMLVQKYRDACAQARSALHQLKDPNRKLSESETRAIVRKVDEILGLTSVDDPQPSAGGVGSGGHHPPAGTDTQRTRLVCAPPNDAPSPGGEGWGPSCHSVPAAADEGEPLSADCPPLSSTPDL